MKKTSQQAEDLTPSQEANVGFNAYKKRREIASKMKVRKAGRSNQIGTGRSHYSGKTYSHN